MTISFRPAFRTRGQGVRTGTGWIALVFLLFSIGGCASLVSSLSATVTTNLAQNLSQAFLNSDDLPTVETGGPAYLLMVDSLLIDAPNNESLLLSATQLYTSYTMAFVKNSERAKRLTDKGYQYALRALCNHHPAACQIKDMPYGEFLTVVSGMQLTDVPVLYAFGAAWAAQLQAHREDFNAIAQIPRIESIMNRVVALDETHEAGAAHLYLGVFATLIPPALGGRPEAGRQHFERALALSGGKNLMGYVLYARHYARMLFDRELHDRLLGHVMASDPRIDGFVLSNMAAQSEARELLASADEYF